MNISKCRIRKVSAVPTEVVVAKTSVEFSPLVVAWERPASTANHREHIDVLESTEVSAVSADVCLI